MNESRFVTMTWCPWSGTNWGIGAGALQKCSYRFWKSFVLRWYFGWSLLWHEDGWTGRFSDPSFVWVRLYNTWCTTVSNPFPIPQCFWKKLLGGRAAKGGFSAALCNSVKPSERGNWVWARAVCFNSLATSPLFHLPLLFLFHIWLSAADSLLGNCGS